MLNIVDKPTDDKKSHRAFQVGGKRKDLPEFLRNSRQLRGVAGRFGELGVVDQEIEIPITLRVPGRVAAGAGCGRKGVASVAKHFLNELRPGGLVGGGSLMDELAAGVEKQEQGKFRISYLFSFPARLWKVVNWLRTSRLQTWHYKNHPLFFRPVPEPVPHSANSQ